MTSNVAIKSTNLILIKNKGYYFLVIFFVAFLFTSQHMIASEFIFHLTSEQWSKPRSVNSILALPVLSSAMKLLSLNDTNYLQIHYPGGDEGSLWALELRAWLISLGLSASKITLIPGSSATNILDLEVITNRIETNNE